MQDQLCSASLTEYFWQGQLYSALPTESFLLNQAAYLLKNYPHPTINIFSRSPLSEPEDENVPSYL
jgi:hypothetical protein